MVRVMFDHCQSGLKIPIKNLDKSVLLHTIAYTRHNVESGRGFSGLWLEGTGETIKAPSHRQQIYLLLSGIVDVTVILPRATNQPEK